jgi:hypothetical protein
VKPAAIYARVSSDKQKEEHTIASQTAALRDFARQQGFSVPDEWVIEDEGYSGATLVRPGLERVRDLAAEGQIDAVLVYSPDRLSRKYAYQVLLIEELARHNVHTVFVKAPRIATPEDQLLLQFQGMSMNGRKFWSGRAGAKGIVPCRGLSTSFAALRMATDISARLSTRPRLTPSSTLRRLWCARSMNTTPSRV